MDFRFFLISIVAVFLALGIGIVLGSGFLGDPLLDTLDGQVKDAIARNGRLQEEIIELESRVEDDDDFANAVEPLVVDGMLTDRNVVVLEMDGTDGVIYDGIQRVVTEAGGSVASRIILRDRLTLGDEDALADANTLLGSTSIEAEEVRAQLAVRIGHRLDAATRARTRARDTRRGPEDIRIEQFLADLEDASFISVEDAGEQAVPSDAEFVLIGGADGDPPFSISGFVDPLVTSLTRSSPAVAVAETSESEWGLVAAIRKDEDAAATVSTIDNIDSPEGRISLAMTLRSPVRGGHWGTGEDAQGPLPTPAG